MARCRPVRPATPPPPRQAVDRYRRLLLKLAASAQAMVLLPLRAVARLARWQVPRIGHDARPASDGRHDFDFLHGHWQIRNERLRQRLAGSDDWEIFHADQVCQPMLGGMGNVDDFVSDWTRPGCDERFIGMTLRLFSPESRQWSIYWAGNHDGVLEPPMVGHFDRWRRHLPSAAANTKAGRCGCASSGTRSAPTPRTGSRRSRRTMARPGKPTGTCGSAVSTRTGACCTTTQ